MPRKKSPVTRPGSSKHVGNLKKKKKKKFIYIHIYINGIVHQVGHLLEFEDDNVFIASVATSCGRYDQPQPSAIQNLKGLVTHSA
jgi:hypothetical protein